MRAFVPALCLCCLLLPASATAQGWFEPRIFPRPAPVVQNVTKVRTTVTVRVTDRIARVDVEEWFRNDGGGIAEGDYLYPLAGEAVFSDFSLFQGEEELKGEAMDAAHARRIYEEIVRRRKDPALIELAGHGLLRARVFPFGPGETRNVRLRYTQVLDRAGDALRFRYLAGVAHRERERVPGSRTPTPASTPITFTLLAEDGSRFGEPFSPTHRLRIERRDDRLTVRPEKDLAGSFDVFLPLAGRRVGITLATHRTDAEDGYFMLTLSPSAAQQIAEPRDIVAVLDVSGSMSGDKIDQAREAMHQLLGSLHPRDRFRLIAFSTRVDVQARDWSAASPGAIREARAWIDTLTATGGTNIAGALEEAFRLPADAGRLRMVIFLTDGLPTGGETDPERIADRLEAVRGDARVFAFGVGYDVHTHLLERMASAGRGTVDFVTPGQNVEEAVSSLAARITHPVLVDLRFAGSPVRLKDVQPSRLPDLFARQDLVVFGRYERPDGTGSGELSIAGMRAGRTERFAAPVVFPEHAPSSPYIPALWAARKLGELMRTIRLEGSTPERVAEARALALRYGLVSEYSSYLVQEPPPTTTFRSVVPIAPAAPASAVAPGTPQAFTGKAAVDTANVAAQRREVRSLADAQAAERVMLDGLRMTAGPQGRLVAGRQFRADAGVWIDSAHRTDTRVLHVEPFSAAYFDILARLPELQPYWSTFDASLVAGHAVSIKVAAGGRSTMGGGDLETLVRDFRMP